MFKHRFISSFVLISIIIALIWWRLWNGVCLIISLFGLIAQWEFYQFQEAKGLKVFKKAGLIGGVLFMAVSYVLLIFYAEVSWEIRQAIESFTILIIILGVLSRQIFEKDQNTPVVTVALTLFGFFYVPFLFNFLLKIICGIGAPRVEGLFLALYLVVVTKSTDIGAYVSGSLMGKHKMMPKISPKKTWEGFLGGILFALGISVLMVKCFPNQLTHLQGNHAWVLGMILPITSVIGDLAESVIKRDANIKDSGGIIPGIGGSLDLIDSILYTAPLFYCYLIVFT